MAKRIKTYVSPNKQQGGWNINKSNKNISHHNTKNNAIQKGIKIARKDSPNGQLVIQKKDGTFQEERTYANDPKKYKG